MEKMGTRLHAEKLQQCYHEQINMHQQCEVCKAEERQVKY